MLDRVIKLCHTNLFGGGYKELSYLYSRGISSNTIRKFQLGSFPSLNILFSTCSKDDLFACGFLVLDGYKQVVSKFETHSLIIPVFDANNNPIAVIGRSLLPDEQRSQLGLPKYINTFYSKGKTLFGMNFAKKHVRKKNKVYIVEGNFDVITAYQHGLKNVVATSGTFFTKHQALLASRYSSQASILFDNDEAGRIASKNVKKKYKDYSALEVKISSLPSTVKDLDEYFQKRGRH